MRDSDPELNQQSKEYDLEWPLKSVHLTKEQQRSMASLVHGCKDAFFALKEEQFKNKEYPQQRGSADAHWKNALTLFTDYTSYLGESHTYVGDQSELLLGLNEKLIGSSQAIESLQAASRNLRERSQLQNFAQLEYPSVAELQGRVHEEMAGINDQIYQNKRNVAVILDAAQRRYSQALELKRLKKNVVKGVVAAGVMASLAYSISNPATGQIDLLDSPLGRGVSAAAVEAANHELISPKAASTIIELQSDPTPELLQYFIDKAIASTKPGPDSLRIFSPELEQDSVVAQEGSFLWQDKQYMVNTSRGAFPDFPDPRSFSLVTFDSSNTNAQFHVGRDLIPGTAAITPEEAYTRYRELHPNVRFLTLPWGWTAEGNYTPRHAIQEHEQFTGNGTIRDGEVIAPMSGANEPNTVVIDGKTYTNPANGSVVAENGALRIEGPEVTKELFDKAKEGLLDKGIDVSQPSWIMDKEMYEDGAYDTKDVYNWTIMIDGITLDGSHKTAIAQFDHLVTLPLESRLKLVIDSVLTQNPDIVDYKIAIGPKGSTTTMSSFAVAKQIPSRSEVLSQTEPGRTNVNEPKAAHVDAAHLVIELK